MFSLALTWGVCLDCAWAAPDSSLSELEISDDATAVPVGSHANLSDVHGADEASDWATGKSCCETDLCCNMCPCNYVWVEGLILERNNYAFDQALVLNLNTDEVLLATDDLDFNTEGGVRAGYCLQTCCGKAWEFGYLGVFESTASAGVVLEDSLILPGDLGLQVNNFFSADEVQVGYGSELHSVEANMVHCCCECDCCVCCSVEWLAGFRYVDLDEEFEIAAFDSEESFTVYGIETQNRLYGAQVGGRARHCHGCWSWEATGKAGVYANDVEQRQAPLIDFPNFEFRPAQSGDDTELAFMGELNLTGIYHLDCGWGICAGYNLIWLDGVARRRTSSTSRTRPKADPASTATAASCCTERASGWRPAGSGGHRSAPSFSQAAKGRSPPRSFAHRLPSPVYGRRSRVMFHGPMKPECVFSNVPLRLK